MAFITVKHTIPDGLVCTKEAKDGYNHCQFRTSTYLNENKKQTVECMLFNEYLQLINLIPYKCEKCLNRMFN